MARSACLLGRAEQSRPKAAQRRAGGAGLDGECAYRAIIRVAAMRTMIGHCPQSRVPVFTIFLAKAWLIVAPLKTTVVPPHPVLPFDIGVPFFISDV